MTRDERLQHYAQLGVSHNTLFDENATCHMALGFAVLDEVEGGTELTAEERHDFGVNHSLVHRDVMLGGPEVDVDGLDVVGNRTPIIRNDAWVLDPG